MEKQKITRLPLKYWPILNMISNESVGKIFKNILWWNEVLDEKENVYFDLIVTDIDAIDKKAWDWDKGWRPKKKPKVIEKSKPMDSDITKPSIDKISIDKINIDEKRKEKKEEKEKNKFLEFVYLSQEEFEKLKEKMKYDSVVNAEIKKLNDYIWQIGEEKARKKYASHYFTILNWWRRDIEKLKTQAQPYQKKEYPIKSNNNTGFISNMFKDE